ncbi:MAG: GtrA family protein [Beijerinckiaceae bacterium]|nr:GtrA family protein [Beijerinckiaceae bacterium]
MSLTRQMSAFVLVGLFSAAAHYGALVGLVELFGWRPVQATLVGYLCGGLTSYVLNRRHTFESDRTHGEAGWRFALVAVVGFCLTWALMAYLIESADLPYLPAQILTTCVVLIWSFIANKVWTFAPSQN